VLLKRAWLDRRRDRLETIVIYDAQKAAHNIATPRIFPNWLRTLSPQAIKLRLTPFVQPNHGFGESFRGFGGGRPQHF
jgi:hypothetical protein